jgi:hypothetical protein
MDYKDIEDLISSQTINNIKDDFTQAKAFFESKDNIKNNTMGTISKSLCKFFKDKKTTTFATTENKKEYEKKEYKINKKNIGTISYYRKNIQPFEDVQTFFEGLKLDEFQKGLKKVMKPEGKQIVEFLISLNDKYKLPQKKSGKKNRLVIEFNPSKEERETFELEETSYICIDEDGLYLDNQKNGDSWSATNLLDNMDNNEGKLTLRSIEEGEATPIMRILFLSKHDKEISELIVKYKVKLEKEFKDWENFKEELNGKLAKYVLLDSLCKGRN